MQSNKHLHIFPIDSGVGNRCRIPCHIFSIIILTPDNTYSTKAHL